MGLFGESASVFEFLRSVYDAFPVAIKLLTLASFGGVILIAIMRGIGR